VIRARPYPASRCAKIQLTTWGGFRDGVQPAGQPSLRGVPPVRVRARIRQHPYGGRPAKSEGAITFRDGPSGTRRRFPCLASSAPGYPGGRLNYADANKQGHAPEFSRHLLPAAALIPG
jgi:hypothetical protein